MVKNILIAKNNLIVLKVKKYYFKSLGYHVTLFDIDGLDALVTAKEYNPDNILMDVRIKDTWMA